MTNEPPPAAAPSLVARLAAALGLAALFPLLGAAAYFVVGGAGQEFAGVYDTALLGHDRWHGFGDGRFAWMFETTRGEMRRPLYWIALAAEHGLPARAAALAVHIASAAFHAAAFAFAAVLTVRLAGAAYRSRALFATAALAAWFLHPLRVEPVACASQQGTVLAGMLLAASAVGWRDALAPGRRGAGRFAGPLTRLVLALLVDPTLCFAPLALVALTLWMRRDEPSVPAETRGPLALAWTAGLLALVATFACREPGGGAPPLASALAAASAIVRPLRATLWPVGLHPGYGAPAGFPDQIAPALWIDAATAAALVAFCVWGVRRRTGLGLALLAYLALAAGPVLLRRDAFGADGDAYVATLPLFIAAGVALTRAFEPLPLPRRATPVAVLVLVALPMFLLTRGRGDAWRDEATIAKSASDADPWNERAYVAMGDAARRAGAPAADLVHWYGIGLEHDDWRPLAHARLGATLIETGDAAGARRHLERAVAIAPWLAAARFDLGALEWSEGHLEAAVSHFGAATRLDAESADAWWGLALTKDACGDREGAEAAMARATGLRPGDPALAEGLRRLRK